MTQETQKELIDLAKWIARRFGLSEMSKVPQACQAEQIHTEIVRRIGEAGTFADMPVIIDERANDIAFVAGFGDMTHESDDPRGPWYPIKDGKITKRYVVKQVTPEG